jgi:hypothetical protein
MTNSAMSRAEALRSGHLRRSFRGALKTRTRNPSRRLSRRIPDRRFGFRKQWRIIRRNGPGAEHLAFANVNLL